MTDGSETMRAAVIREYGSDPQIEKVPVPVAGPGEALVKVTAVGLCATDLKVISGALDGSTSLPRTPGHEIAGVVVDCEARPELVGQNVAVYLYSTCGRCEYCLSGRPTLCRQAVRPGIERDGGLAEFVVVDARTLLPIAPETSPEAAAVAMDAVLTPWGALVGKADIAPGDDVLVVGCGGLGSNAVQIALRAGARVAVIDPVGSHRETGLRLGAEIAVEPGDEEKIKAWSRSGLGVRAALDTSGRREGFDSAVASVAPGARIVCNGYQPGLEFGMDSSRLVLDEISIAGSRVASLEEARDALDAVEDGSVRPEIMRVMPLEDLGEALQMLRDGRVNGRLVLRPGLKEPEDVGAPASRKGDGDK